MFFSIRLPQVFFGMFFLVINFINRFKHQGHIKIGKVFRWYIATAMVAYFYIKLLDFCIVQFVPRGCVRLKVQITELRLVVHHTRENVRGYSSIVFTQHRVRTQSIATNIELGKMVFVGTVSVAFGSSIN